MAIIMNSHIFALFFQKIIIIDSSQLITTGEASKAFLWIPVCSKACFCCL